MGNASLANLDLLPAIGELVVDKYRVVRLLGSGGMGSVLEARHVALGHSVALKVLHQPARDGDESSLRFFREARATASLESEHVIRIFDLGTTDQGLPFLVMERLSGFDLGDVLLRIGPFSPSLALECVLQAARGITHAHEAGIVHRDLKPSNLFLTRRADGRPLVKVLDFGISKLQNDDSIRLTQTRTVVGSPLYMSPEQVRDARQVDFRTDVWSLGAILYELLSGAPAFDGETLPAVYASIVTDEPAAIDRTDVPDAVFELVRRCLAKDRRDRPATVEELVRCLEVLSASLPSALLGTLDLPFPAREREDDSRPPIPSFSGARPVLGAQSADAIRTSATRKRLTPATSPTLSSGDSQAHVPRRPFWPWLGLALGLCALGLAGALVLLQGRDRQGASSAAVVPMHSLDIDSTPSGALVLEQGRVLGRTPLRLPMRAGETNLRELVFEAKGFLPHVARIEPLNEDRTLAVAMVPEPPPAAAPPEAISSKVPSPTPPVSSTPARAGRPTRAPSPRTASPTAASAAEAPTATEIHLSR